MDRYYINSKGEADHLSTSYYLADDVAVELARLAAIEAAARELLEHYHETDDEFTSTFWVDEDYNKVLSSDDSRKWFLSDKKIAERKLAAMLEKAGKE